MVTSPHTQLDLVRDFVNTLDLETGIDAIATPDELATWLSEQGLVDDLVEPTTEEHADALAVREAIRELLLANNGGAADTEAASKTLEEAGRRAHLGVRFENGRPVLAPEGDGRTRRDRPHRRAGRGACARRRMEAAQDVPRRDLPRGLLRQVAQPLAGVVLDGGLRQPRQATRLPRTPQGLGNRRERKLDGVRRSRGAQRALHFPARLEHDDRPSERERQADLRQRAVATTHCDHRIT